MGAIKRGTSQQLTQQTRISAQQIRFLELLQLSSEALEERISKEIESNPVLEEEPSSSEETDDPLETEELSYEQEYMRPLRTRNMFDHAQQMANLQDEKSLEETLKDQLGLCTLSEKQKRIGQQLIGSLESDGYLRRPLLSIIKDLRLEELEVTESEVEEVLENIQGFDPPGIAARSLKECLLLQLQHKEHTLDVLRASDILRLYFEEFTKKHYTKIMQKMHLSEEQFREALHIITHLHPKPGETSRTSRHIEVQRTPDFVLKKTTQGFKVQLLNARAYGIKMNSSYLKLLQKGKKDPRMRQTHVFLHKKIEAAKWFLQALVQREERLLGTAQVIVSRQTPFLHSGDPMDMKPMNLKEIADELNIDPSTVSRIVNQKTIQTSFGVFSLKHFFTQAIPQVGGEGVSNRAVRKVLHNMIQSEDKAKPLSDEALHTALVAKGYAIARRTVAKYREQLKIPVARLRKHWQ